MDGTFRILSLDGGGIKGTFTASVVAALEEMIDGPLAQYFDLITGTSTGGIIALGLGLGFTGRELLDLYVNKGPKIFGSTGFYNRTSRILLSAFQPRHSQEQLRRVLSETFGTRRLGESTKRLVIPSFRCNSGQVELFKTSHHDRFRVDYKVDAVDIALATSAAPTYFEASTDVKGQSYIDGGVWANCPIVAGLLEAIHVLDVKPTDIRVLSIGTTQEAFMVNARERSGGKLRWGAGLFRLLMHAQMEAALAQSNIISGDRVTRINPYTKEGFFSLDDVSRIAQLSGHGRECARDAFERKDADLQQKFFYAPASPFIPCHKLPSTANRSQESMQAAS
jgi:patatin-like phospholipase/acyl hydrolase